MKSVAGRLAGCVLLGMMLPGSAALGAAETDAQADKFLRAGPGEMQWFRDAKFGLFIHWGPVSLKGTEIGWSRGGPRRGTGADGTQIPVAEYDNLYKEFNPVRFDAPQWVEMARSAGMKYLVFTTKHHDGFSMFDTALSDYKITASPFGRDVTAELAKACQEAGLRLGFYYSPVDWYHPDYRTENHARYIEFLHGQLRELCTRYGKVDIIWFDSLGGTAQDWDSKRLFKMIRTLQPGVIINNRAGLPADYDTPEQRIGRYQTDRAWETCMTIGDQWAWKPNDRIKWPRQCIEILVRTVGGDGNLLFNVGPMPTGEIEPRQVDRLREMGRWLTDHGTSIYGTRGGPFPPQPWGVSTFRDKQIFLHILRWYADRIQLPAVARKVVRASVLGGGAVDVKQTNAGIEITVAEADRKPINTVVSLEFDGPVSRADVAPFHSGSLACGKPVTSSNAAAAKNAECGPARAVDDDYSTSWLPGLDVKPPWLEVDLQSETTVSRAIICEAFDFVRAFELQARHGEEWRTFAKGTTIGERLVVDFEPLTARHVRLVLVETAGQAEIGEFQLFAADR